MKVFVAALALLVSSPAVAEDYTVTSTLVKALTARRQLRQVRAELALQRDCDDDGRGSI
jgi:hypothetical protein